MSSTPKIYVAGHRGMVGSAIVRQLKCAGHNPESLVLKAHRELELPNLVAVQAYFAAENPSQFHIASVKVGRN
jgi:GDP-L-fucose synthase